MEKVEREIERGYVSLLACVLQISFSILMNYTKY